MAQVIEDRASHGDAESEDRPEPPTARSVRRSALAVVALVIVIAAALAIRSTTSATPVARPSLAPGTTIAIEIQCGSAGAACVAYTTAPDGTGWIWASSTSATVPATWVGRQILGEIRIESDWGPSTFIAGDQSIAVQGGKSAPGHSFFG